MTVPGKGGRPRKWASDADRVRAFRARLTGLDEPPTVEESIDRGGEDAAVWARVRQLSETMNQQRDTLRSLERELRSTRRALADQQKRFGWLAAENEHLRAQIKHHQNRVTDEPSATRSGAIVDSVRHTRPPTLNRAERRAAERRRR